MTNQKIVAKSNKASRVRKAVCKRCQKLFEYDTPPSVLNSGFRPRKYCSDECRREFYRAKYSGNHKKQQTMTDIAFGG